MKKKWIWVIALLLPGYLMAQRPDPVHWNYSVEKIKGNVLEIHLIATIDDDWHIYAQAQPEEAVAVPTKIVFARNPLVKVTGKPRETGTKETYEDKAAGIVQYQYGGKVEFVQQVALKANVKTNVTGSITYQACTGEMCLPPKTISFTITLNN